MTFIEVLILLDSRGEKIVTDKTHVIQTDKFIYSREPNGEWVQKELPIKTIVVDPYPLLEPVLPPQTKKKNK